MDMDTNGNWAERAIRACGNAATLAREVEVSQTAVGVWRKTGRRGGL